MERIMAIESETVEMLEAAALLKNPTSWPARFRCLCGSKETSAQDEHDLDTLLALEAEAAFF